MYLLGKRIIITGTGSEGMGNSGLIPKVGIPLARMAAGIVPNINLGVHQGVSGARPVYLPQQPNRAPSYMTSANGTSTSLPHVEVRRLSSYKPPQSIAIPKV
jgi:hypothetical protein